MKQEIINNLQVVINALNSVTVCGKSNLLNLSGSIAMLEDTVKRIADFETESKSDAPKE